MRAMRIGYRQAHPGLVVSSNGPWTLLARESRGGTYGKYPNNVLACASSGFFTSCAPWKYGANGAFPIARRQLGGVVAVQRRLVFIWVALMALLVAFQGEVATILRRQLRVRIPVNVGVAGGELHSRGAMHRRVVHGGVHSEGQRVTVGKLGAQARSCMAALRQVPLSPCAASVSAPRASRQKHAKAIAMGHLKRCRR